MIVTSCSGNGSNTIAEDSQEQKDTFYFVHPTTKDTIPTNELREVNARKDNRSGNRSSQNIQRDTFNLNNLSYSYRQEKTWFDMDSLESFVFGVDTVFRTSDTFLIEKPKIFETQGIKILVKEPQPVKCGELQFTAKAKSNIQVLGKSQGLPSDNTSCVIMDHRGLLWFGTDAGLVKFDGTYLTIYDVGSGLPDDNINCLTEGKDGCIWIGTQFNGIVKFDGENFYHYSDKDGLLIKGGITDVEVDSKGVLWAGSYGGGVIRIDDNTLAIYERPSGVFDTRINGLVVDKHDNVWVTPNGQRPFYLTEDRITYMHGNPEFRFSGYHLDAMEDSKGRIWFSGYQTFAMIDDNEVSFFYFPSGLQGQISPEMMEDKEGNIWFASYAFGLFQLTEKELIHYNEENGLSSFHCFDICADQQDNLWIATEGGGICRFDRNSFEFFTENNGLSSREVNAIYERSNGNILLGTKQGVHELTDTAIYLYNKVNGWPGRLTHYVTDLYEDDSGWVYVTFNGISGYRFRNDTLTGLGKGHVGDHNVVSLAQDTRGTFWFALGHIGLTRMDSSRFSYYLGHEELGLQDIIDIEADRSGNAWFGSSVQGLTKYDGKAFTHYSTNEGLIDNQVTDITIDSKNRVWIGTMRGLSVFNGKEFTNINEKDGLPNRRIASIVEANNGDYWIGTNNGLAHLKYIGDDSKSFEFELKDYEIHSYGKKNGLVSSTFIPNSALIDSKNRLWMGTSGGLVVRDLKKNKESSALSCELNTIKIRNRFIDYRQLVREPQTYESGAFASLEGQFSNVSPFQNYPENLTLPYEYNHLTFYFSAHNWTDVSDTRFQYFLEGFDEEWSEIHPENWAEYRNLDYGSYTFRVKSISNDGTVSKECNYSFSVLPPWYHTWWMRIFYLISLAALIYLLVKSRTKHLRARQLELEAKISEATNEIRLQKEEIEIQNLEIKDSIAYAKRIQSAILPPNRIVKEYLQNSFILYKPKDIVAGDFYWMEHLGDWTLFAAADCTGHGVPGAMVSVVCNNALNRAVREFNLSDPGRILDKTREIVIEEFDKADEEMKDGMDISLCAISGAKLLFSGANNPLWIIRDGELLETKGNKQPVGKFSHAEQFTTHVVELKSGDCIYLTSDGFADQFGGDRGKKFKAANFKRLLLSLQDKSMDEQMKRIDEAFEEWRGDLEQVDDVCVIGVRVP